MNELTVSSDTVTHADTLTLQVSGRGNESNLSVVVDCTAANGDKHSETFDVVDGVVSVGPFDSPPWPEGNCACLASLVKGTRTIDTASFHIVG